MTVWLFFACGHTPLGEPCFLHEPSTESVPFIILATRQLASGDMQVCENTESVMVLLQVTFEQDVMLSQANEYEVLQLLLGECKTRLGGYAGAP